MNFITDKNRSFWCKLGLLAVTMIWGSSFVVVKNTTASLSPSAIIFFRFSLAAVLLAAVFFRRLKNITREAVSRGALIGATTFTAYELQTYGVEYTTAGNNAFLTGIYCVAVPFLAWAMFRRRPTRWQVVSAFLCISGVGLLSLQGGFQMNRGDLLSLLSGLCFAMQIIEIDLFTAKNDPVVLTIFSMTATALLSLPGMLFSGQPVASPEPELILVLVYLGIVSTALTSLAQTVCQKYVEPAAASLIMSLEAVFGVLAGVVFLREPVTVRSLGGCALIFGAILLSEKRPDAKKTDVPPAK